MNLLYGGVIIIVFLTTRQGVSRPTGLAGPFQASLIARHFVR